jgi:tRNA pseudouridine55 synthase
MRRTKSRINWRDVHGLLLLDKPSGLSSNQALQRARQIYAAAKGGHTGSLDPLATGLLPLCFGEATKIAGMLLGAFKAYEVECELGIITDSGDSDGAVVEQRAVPDLDAARIESALAPLRGRIEQVPPIYSALKRGGEPMYRLARRGESVEIAARTVEVRAFDLLARVGNRLHLHVECGSGTYVRSLVRDLGEALACGAHVTRLRRIWVEPFRNPVMVTLDQLGQLADSGFDALDRLLLPIEQGLAGYPVVVLDPAQALRLGQGQGVASTAPAGICLAKSGDGRLLALAEVGPDARMRCLRGFNLP